MTEKTDELIGRVLDGKASCEEIRELADWVRMDERHRSYFRQWQKVWHVAHDRKPSPERQAEALKQFTLYMRQTRTSGRHRSLGRRVAAVAGTAAAVALFLFAGLWDKEAASPDALPLAHAVQLVLPDGSRHELTEERTVRDIVAVAEGRTGVPGGMSSGTDTEGVPVEEYNEIIVPRGTEYTFPLPDGSSVMLNAGSRLKFPMTFAGAERRVLLSGEAYFEVVRDEARPFFVEFSAGTVRVLGTEFNVNAYEGRPASAVLVSGKVEVAAGDETVALRPGQLCEVLSEGLAVGEADLMVALAWKNGEFVFKDASWKQVMDELGRWYDADIRYEASEMDELKLYIYMERTATLPEALEVIARVVDISYSVEGRKVIIKRR